MTVVAQGRPRKRISGLHAKSLLRCKLDPSRLGRLTNNILDVALPNWICLPYPSEDVFWMLLQKDRQGSAQQQIAKAG